MLRRIDQHTDGYKENSSEKIFHRLYDVFYMFGLNRLSKNRSHNESTQRSRKTEGDYESYITETVGKIKAGMTKKAADTLLIEIGEKIAKAGV